MALAIEKTSKGPEKSRISTSSKIRMPTLRVTMGDSSQEVAQARGHLRQSLPSGQFHLKTPVATEQILHRESAGPASFELYPRPMLVSRPRSPLGTPRTTSAGLRPSAATLQSGAGSPPRRSSPQPAPP